MLVIENRNYPETAKAFIPLQNGLQAIIDPIWLSALNQMHWYAKRSFSKVYVCSKVIIKGKVTFLRMHRIVAHTPRDMVCHHINHNTLDNRAANLLNLTPYEHKEMHSYR